MFSLILTEGYNTIPVYIQCLVESYFQRGQRAPFPMGQAQALILLFGMTLLGVDHV